MPRLKDMLEQNGLNLQNANVSQNNDNKDSHQGAQKSSETVVYEDGSNQLSQNNESEFANSTSSKNYLLEAFA